MSLRVLFVSFAALAAAAGAALAQPAAAPPMSPEALARHIETLSSDAYGGRAPDGGAGEKLTVQYLTEQFRAAGLKPAGANGSFVQPVPLDEYTLQGRPGLTVRGADGAKTYAYEADWVVWSRTGKPRASVRNADLVFAGYGVTAPEAGWSDYAGADIKGKIAVVLINDPDFETAKGLEGPFGGKAMTYYGRWVYKFEEAARQGAAGVLIVHETAPAAYGWPVVTTSWTAPQLAIGGDKLPRMPIEAWITGEAAQDLFRRAGLDFAALKAAAQKPGFKAVPMNLQASAEVRTRMRRVMSANVVGVIEGTTRPQESVLYSAHWDHLGRCAPVGGDDICNGALDNASGTAGLIEIARAFAAGPRPERSVVFLAVTAEEKGLLGSEYYAQNPIFPIATTAANINMDGLPGYGLTRNVGVVGSGKTNLDEILDRYAAAQGRYLTPDAFPERGSYYRSDQFSFAKVGVPGMFAKGGLDLVNGGQARGRELDADYLANRYHKPDDEYQASWDLSGASQDLALLYAVGRDLAEGRAWPEWRQGVEFKPIRDRTAAERR